MILWILHFLIEQRDKCLKKLEEFANSGVFKHSYHVYHHPPVYTCEEVEKLCPKIEAGLKCGEMKNLFLADKKKKLYLISALVNTEVNLKAIAKLLGTKDLRFANEEKLKENLNLLPGSVTPFGLLNDSDGLVKYYLDKKAVDTSDHFGFQNDLPELQNRPLIHPNTYKSQPKCDQNLNFTLFIGCINQSHFCT